MISYKLQYIFKYSINRIRIEESGNLVITKLATSDQGRYVCVAQNIVGIRETTPVLLTVNGNHLDKVAFYPSKSLLFVLAIGFSFSLPLSLHVSDER